MPETAKLAARVSAQLSREAPHTHIDEIARDAVRIAGDALQVRTTNAPRAVVARVQRVARKYRARAVYAGDAHGMALGLRFSSGRYSSAADDVMFLV